LKPFEAQLTYLWNENMGNCGDAYLEVRYNSLEVRLFAQQKYMEDLFHDNLGLVLQKLIRIIVGVDLIEYFESIKDESKQSKSEHQVLNFAKVHPSNYPRWIEIQFGQL